VIVFGGVQQHRCIGELCALDLTSMSWRSAARGLQEQAMLLTTGQTPGNIGSLRPAIVAIEVCGREPCERMGHSAVLLPRPQAQAQGARDTTRHDGDRIVITGGGVGSGPKMSRDLSDCYVLTLTLTAKATGAPASGIEAKESPQARGPGAGSPHAGSPHVEV
jgi:hypothetical protein